MVFRMVGSIMGVAGAIVMFGLAYLHALDGNVGGTVFFLGLSFAVALVPRLLAGGVT